MFVFHPFQTTDSFVKHRKVTLSVRPWEIREFKKLRRQLQWNRDIKIELCVKLSLLRLFHVGHSVQNWRTALSLAWHEWFSCKGKDWKIYCCEFASSSEQISRRCLPDYVKTMDQKACRTCSTIIFLHPTNQIIDLWRWRWRWRCCRQILNSLLLHPLLHNQELLPHRDSTLSSLKVS